MFADRRQAEKKRVRVGCHSIGVVTYVISRTIAG